MGQSTRWPVAALWRGWRARALCALLFAALGVVNLPAAHEAHAAREVRAGTRRVLAGSSWRLLPTPSVVPSPRSGYGLAFDDARGRLVLFGGGCQGAVCGGPAGCLGAACGDGDTWVFDRTGWRQLPVAGPIARQDMGMVYDSRRHRVVLFGGHLWADGYTNDTWEFDGRTWTSIPTAHAPTERSNVAMAYDPRRGRVVLFGGWTGTQAGTDILGETWEYDGTDWRQILTAHAPQPRAGARLVYVPAWGKLVLFGGLGQPGQQEDALNDTWTYDGTDWTPLPMSLAPSPRYDYQMAYDPRQRAVVLFGGYNQHPLDDTWAFDGAVWHQENLPVHPPATFDATALSLPMQQGIVLFGGDGPTYPDNDLVNTTWVYRFRRHL